MDPDFEHFEQNSTSALLFPVLFDDHFLMMVSRFREHLPFIFEIKVFIKNLRPPQ